MISLDEAIKHAEEVAKEHTKYNIYGGFESCDECAKEHWQLAEWLRELKAYKEQTDGNLISRQAVLDLCGTGKWLEEYRAEENGVKTRGYDTLKMINYTKLLKLPAIPQTDYENYEEFGWCKGCKEYDTEKHCCHRYSSFIRESLQNNINAVLEDIKAEIKQEYNCLSATRADETLELGECLGLKMSLKIIDNHISGKEE